MAIGVWRSLVSRLVRVQEASGSNPDTPTIEKQLSFDSCFSIIAVRRTRGLLHFNPPQKTKHEVLQFLRVRIPTLHYFHLTVVLRVSPPIKGSFFIKTAFMLSPHKTQRNFTLHNYKMRGKLILRHNFITLITTSVRFYLYGKNACSISHTCGMKKLCRSNRSNAFFVRSFGCALFNISSLQYSLKDNLYDIFHSILRRR